MGSKVLAGSWILLASACWASVCMARPLENSARPLVIVSVYPVEAMVREIAGDSIDVRSALPDGRSEHDYEPSAKDVRLLKSANLILVVDRTMDAWMIKAAGNQVPVFPLLETANPLPYGKTIGVAALGAGASKTMADQLDPHFWTDPERMITAAMRVVNHMRELAGMMPGFRGPDERELFARFQAFAARMTKLKEALKSKAAEWPKTSVILTHGSIGYFAAMTGLKLVGVIEPVPHMEPGPRHLRGLIEAARANKPCVVLAEEQIDDAAARALAREAGIKVARINPLGSAEGRNKKKSSRKVDSAGGEYDRYIEGLAAEISKGLSGK